ncbi:MAG: hypothetical protein V4579_04040 [Pseudomonadota bacterium]
MHSSSHQYSWHCALELEQERGGLGAFVYAASRVEELQVSKKAGDLALWREIYQRISDLHMLENRVLH